MHWAGTSLTATWSAPWWPEQLCASVLQRNCRDSPLKYAQYYSWPVELLDSLNSIYIALSLSKVWLTNFNPQKNHIKFVRTRPRAAKKRGSELIRIRPFTLCLGGPVAQSVQRLPTGWTVRGSNPGGGEIFRTCPDRPWGTPILQYNGYRVFPRGKVRPGRDADPSPPSSAEVKNRVELYLYSS
jgi:hypothetical protein